MKTHPSEITSEDLYLRRREFLRRTAVAGTGLALAPALGCEAEPQANAAAEASQRDRRLANVMPGPFSSGEEPTSWKKATSYNNFYEFGSDKDDPAQHSGSLRTQPWSVAIEGEVAKPGLVPLEDLLRPHPLQERTYRLRCVEAWSMVIPWVGIPLGDVLRAFEPTSSAKFVEFTTLYDPEQMPGQRRRVLDWPYVEGLRIDEAMHPLSLLAVGMYGRVLPNQNGAPIRLVVPWKYGFKSIKSIVRIRLTREQPESSWMRSAPSEYGFYANVNPEVDHPRWSQARERRIGDFRKRPTLPFNGYAEEVAGLYRGMDLRARF